MPFEIVNEGCKKVIHVMQSVVYDNAGLEVEHFDLLLYVRRGALSGIPCVWDPILEIWSQPFVESTA